MEILEQYTDMAGKIRMVARLSNGETIPLKFQSQPTTQQLETIEASYIDHHLYDGVQQETISILDHADLIREFISLVKQNPTVTLTQYNTWLSKKEWWESAVIRFFVFKLATALSAKADVVLTDYTESQVMQKLRNWIVATPVRKISKVIFNME